MTGEWHILSIDGDPHWRDQMATYLGRHGYRVSPAYTARDLWRKLDQQAVGLVLLGPNAQGAAELELLRQLRSASAIPVIMTDPANDASERIVALELGADDYLQRPCNPRELLARIRNLQRRCGAGNAQALPPSTLYRFAGWTFNPQRAALQAPTGTPVRLTASERNLLKVLVESPQRVFSRERLVRLIGDPDRDLRDRSVDMLVWRLRSKLGTELIRTERSAGYVFAAVVEVLGGVAAQVRLRRRADDIRVGQ